MSYTSGFTHSRCGYYYLKMLVKIYKTGFVTCNGGNKSFKNKWIYTLINELKSILIKAVILIFIENIGRLYGERTVNVYKKIIILRKKMIFLISLKKYKSSCVLPTANEGITTLPPLSKVSLRTAKSSFI